jgi:hypothetical protein
LLRRALGDEGTYLPLRRIVLWLERTLGRVMQWVGFEPNDEPLWLRFLAFFRRIRSRPGDVGPTKRQRAHASPAPDAGPPVAPQEADGA